LITISKINELENYNLKDLMLLVIYSVYNFANFDTVFLLKKLTKHGIVNSIIYKGKIVIVLLTFSNQKDFRLYIIHFRNSHQLLLSSLSKLGINFKINTIKDIFSYRFIKFNNLNYIGSVLLFEYFDNIGYIKYNNYINTYNKV